MWRKEYITHEIVINTKEAAENQPPLCVCRDDRTRTGDPYVPNVVRYQLRYIPIAAAKV